MQVWGRKLLTREITRLEVILLAFPTWQPMLLRLEIQ
jgi:hypothetical protein